MGFEESLPRNIADLLPEECRSGLRLDYEKILGYCYAGSIIGTK